jgi:IS30 family transposase
VGMEKIMEKIHEANKHLTYEERTFIEVGLNQGRSYTEIAKDINKDRRTIAREIEKHKFKKKPGSFNGKKNFCERRFECNKFECTETERCYREEVCEYLLKPPYVCNGCEKKNRCRKIKKYYYAKFANDEYKETLSSKRIGINLSKEEAYDIDTLIKPLIKEKHQTIAHVYANHPDEITFSRTTMYKYINLGVFSLKNIDLPRKVKYKARKKNENQRIRRETAIRKGRKYEDFEAYMEEHKNVEVVEMDTVEGTKGGKVFLTIMFRNRKFMIMYLMEHKNMECVENAFKDIREKLGLELYKKLFEVILTDNGSEFFNPMSIEKVNNEIVSHIFYCDPGASWQKGAIEKNHEYIRYILPKKRTFDNLTEEQVNKIKSHINSISRDSLGGKCPYDKIEQIITKEILNKMGYEKVNADEVMLSPTLLKGGDR